MFFWLVWFHFEFFLGGLFCYVSLLSFFFLGGGGVKGQVRWPEGPPHSALNPPYHYYYFCFVFCFVLFYISCLQGTKHCFPLERLFSIDILIICLSVVYFIFCFSFFPLFDC